MNSPIMHLKDRRAKNVSSFSQPKNLQFNPEKLYQVRPEFNGRTTQRYQYTVTESKIGSVWKYLTVNK
jgi:hypothetical protein